VSLTASTASNANKLKIDAPLVRRLIKTQFPQWATLEVWPVEKSGWDNRTFHLGHDMLVRLPSAEGYASQVAKEQRWLPFLAQHLPLPIPSPLAQGALSEDFPFPWSVYGWLEGETASLAGITDLNRFASDLARFLKDLQSINATDGPTSGQHSQFRGGSLTHWDADTRAAIVKLEGRIDTVAATAVWNAALETTWNKDPVWFHGDVALGNLLINNGELSAVIDFGCAGVGDPACDLVIAWTLFTGQARDAFRAGLNLDEATWARGRGWALWKALITLAGITQTNAAEAANAQEIITRVIEDHEHHSEQS
jgi:aminoglycoside phosphotransferase (APT) family kinase protein